ncbi:MAG: hypothetical protein ACRENO_05095, partial [Thermodesulfobacteriota bacterium]
AKVSFKLTPYDNEAENDLKKGDLASLLVRMIADGMDERAKLNRLFEDQLKQGPFPEAASILWKISSNEAESRESIVLRKVELYLSYEWVKDFGNIDSYDSGAFSDK